MGSGLIYAVIIAMWGAYFIPLCLRRHEERSESRSVERFSRAMRILSRRTPTTDRRYVVMPPRSAGPAGPPAGDPYRDGRDHPHRGRPARPSPRATSLALRRRRILAGLVLATGLTALLAPLTPVPWWAPVGLLAGTVADLVHLRLQTRHHLELSRSRDSIRRRTLSRLHRVDSTERILAARRTLRAERAAAEEALRVEQEAAAAAARARAEGWAPVPVPLPTYVTKPMARSAARSAATTSEAPFDQSAEAASVRPAPAAADTHELDELDAILDRGRAVNG